MHLCWLFKENVFCGEISSRGKVGLVVPSGEIEYGTTVGGMLSSMFPVFFSVVLKKIPVFTNQKLLFSLDIRRMKSEI